MGEGKSQSFFQPPLRWVLAIGILGSVAAIGAGFYQVANVKQESQVQPVASPTTAQINYVSALGRLEPEGEVIKLSAASSQGAGMSKVDQILVQDGEKVEKGQIVAILDNRDRLQADVDKAKQQIKVAEANLARVKAGAKTGEIAAQKAEVARLTAQQLREIDVQKAEISRLQAQRLREIDANRANISRIKADLENAEKECQRYEQLIKDGAVATSVRDAKCLEQRTAQERLNEATANLQRIEETTVEQIKAAKSSLQRIEEAGVEQINAAKSTLNQIAEVRPVDIQVAEAELSSAIASLRQAQAELATAYIKSPVTGEVLKVNTRPGETVSNDGIVEIGKTSQMYVVAEVYESDVNQVRQGQTATITSKGFNWKLQGIVAQKALRVAKKDVLNTDPAADVDARVVEVKIRLNPEDSEKVKGLTNLQVETRISI